MIAIIVLIKDGEDAETVRYADPTAGANPLLAGGLVLNRSALHDPAPDRLEIRLLWEQVQAPARAAHADGERRAAESARPWPQGVNAGDRLTVVKSQTPGVRSPPEWLDQYVGRTGRVLWTTPDGAMLDLDGKASWFSFRELKPGS